MAQFKRVLLMADDEELPLDGSYFDLGLTSVALTEIKDRLEEQLDLAIDATVLFNQPTVDQLVTHLTGVLFEDAGTPVSTVDSAAGTARQESWQDVRTPLYQA